MSPVSLYDICLELHNFWDVSRHFDTFTISDGEIDLSELVAKNEIKPGQYYRVVGSIFNDGIYQFGVDDLRQDETFYGGVWLLAIPHDIVLLVEKINAWKDAHSDDLAKLDGPYQSESFNGYSYSLRSALADGSVGADDAWKKQFRSALNQWRKIKI